MYVSRYLRLFLTRKADLFALQIGVRLCIFSSLLLRSPNIRVLEHRNHQHHSPISYQGDVDAHLPTTVQICSQQHHNRARALIVETGKRTDQRGKEGHAFGSGCFLEC